jgi:small subunit ribosomal protein S6
MREYEVAVVFDVGDETLPKAREQVKSEFDKISASIVKEDDMNARDLAYPIGKQTRGHYYLYNVQAEPEKIGDLDRAFKLTAGVLKYLVVKKE